MDLDIDHLRRWIGSPEHQSELLTPALVERFHATFDRQGPLDAGAEAPLLIHLCLTQPAVPASALGPEGHPARGGFLPPVTLPRRMWAGGHFQFHAPLRIGELVARRSHIADVVLKTGRSGALCFVTVVHQVHSGDRLAVTEQQDIVYRAAKGAVRVDEAAPVPAAKGDHRRSVSPDATLLFRYSALTFNGHRIHYDHPYVTQTEGYPGLMVHGPLQATLLAQYAHDLKGRAPAEFQFRSLSPLFDTSDFALNATADSDAMTLWTATNDGPVAMSARATW